MVATLAILPAAAQGEHDYAIKSEPLGAALKDFALKSGKDVVFDASLTRGKVSPGVEKAPSDDAALAALLLGSGLSFTQTGSGGFAIQATPKNVQAASNEAAKEAATNVETIVVTGSRIIGGDPADHVKTYDRAAIEQTGAATLADFAQTMTENVASVSYAGSLASGTGGPNNSGSGLNGGSGFNLHGLGPEATLTLVNGHRLVGSGSSGEFVDISLIPLAAVQRVEVLTDGASAIYGSDAVAGVVNIILRNDFDGAETSAQNRATIRGGGDEFTASQILGTSWSGGHIMGVYQFANQQTLLGSQRGFVPNLGGSTALIPKTNSNSAFLTASQLLDDATTISADGMFSEKNFKGDSFQFSQIHNTGESHQYAANLAVAHDFGADWHAQLVGSYSVVAQVSGSSVGAGANTSYAYDFSSKEIHLDAAGPLLTLPGGAVQVALGGEYRNETDHNGSDIHSEGFPSSLSRDVGSVFTEAHIPIIGSDNAIPGAARLEISLAGRYDHYSDFGGAFSPHVGALWSPVTGVDLRGSYSQAYRAPRLDQLFVDPVYSALNEANPAAPGGVSDFLINGSLGNSNLQPERSNTSTIGVDIHPEIIPGLDLSATYFDTAFKGQISRPPVTTTFFAPSLAPYLNCSPNLADVQAVFASGHVLADRTHLGAAGIQCTFDNRITNLARSAESGLEFEASYAIATDNWGKFTLRGSVDWMLGDNYVTATGTKPVELLDQYGEPLRVKLRGGIGWTNGQWTSAVDINHASAYENNLFTPAAPIGAWTTLDVNVAYALGSDEPDSMLRGTRLALTVQNLFDADPPTAPLPSGFFNLGYDPINANPFGRVISIKIDKSW